MDTKIKKYLDSSGITYIVKGHRKVYTAFTEAETQALNPRQVVKAVLVKFDKPISFLELPIHKIEKFQYLLAAIPAGNRLDFKKINNFVLSTQNKLYKKLIKKNPKLPKPIKIKASMAKEKDISTKLKTKIGLISPLGAYGMPILLDKKLTKHKNLVMSAGSYTESVSIKTKDYIKLNNPIIGQFTE